MNKTEFIATVADKTGVTQAEAGRMVEAMLATVTEALARGEDVRLTGFGNFEVAEQAARKGRNPRTGEEINIPASKAPKFRAGATLKTAVDNVGAKT